MNDVAIYGAVSRLIIVISIPLKIINSVLSPVIADLYYRNEVERLEKTIRSVSTIAMVPSVLVMLLFCCFGNSLLELLYGQDYSEGYPILMILAMGQLFNVLSGPCGTALLMTGNQRIMMIISVLVSILAIAVSILAAIHLGAVAVAMVFAAAVIIQNILMIYFVRKKTGVTTFLNFRFAFPVA
jgi:O-antigen/teichoic acid export membrane protein